MAFRIRFCDRSVCASPIFAVLRLCQASPSTEALGRLEVHTAKQAALVGFDAYNSSPLPRNRLLPRIRGSRLRCVA